MLTGGRSVIPVIAAPDCSLNLGLRVQIPDHDVLTLKPEGQQPTVCATPSLSQFTPSTCLLNTECRSKNLTVSFCP